MFKQRAGLLKHQKYARCKPISFPLTTEEAENSARIAKEQFITLNGRLSTNQNACGEDDLIQFENYYEIISDDVEMGLASPKEENEDWQYEYLDEALIRLMPIDEKETNPFEIIEEQNDVYTITKCDRKPEKKKSPLKRSLHYECDFCCKQFSSRSSIITHLIMHKTIADYDCNECTQTFKTQGNLSRHFRNMHNNSKNWACEKCGKLFREKFQLDIHVPNHDERKLIHFE